MKPGMIAIEEHLIVPDQRDRLSPSFALAQKQAELLDYGRRRLDDMDAADIDIAVLSAFSDGLQGLDTTDSQLGASREQRIARQAETAVRWNDQLAQIIGAHPERFRGFAALPMADPDVAAQELARSVRDLGMVGALVNGADTAADGSPNFYTDTSYDVVWQTLVDLGRPLYIHPRLKTTADPFYELPNCDVLRGSPWGFHENTARITMALIVNGVFQRFPDLQVILGHMGEFLPFWAWRIDHRLQMEGRPELATVQAALAGNISVTVSGFNSTPALRHVIDVMGTDRVLVASDYPMEDAAAMSGWLAEAFEEIGLDSDQVERIRSGNAKRLLGI